MKNLANIITSLRILFSVSMLFTQPFSAFFWVCYLIAGLSDVLDGFFARKLDQESDLGAKLDSVADLIFAGVLAIVFIRNIEFPGWLLICLAGIALLRIISFMIGFIKYRTLASLHTYLNKVTGAMVFLFPLLYGLFEFKVSIILLCSVAFVSAMEELLITITSNKLNPERRSLFVSEVNSENTYN